MVTKDKGTNARMLGAGLVTLCAGSILYLYGLKLDDSGLGNSDFPLLLGGVLQLAGGLVLGLSTWRIRCAEIRDLPEAAKTINRANRIGFLTSVGILCVSGAIIAAIFFSGHHPVNAVKIIKSSLPLMLAVIMLGFAATNSIISRFAARSNK